MGTLTVLVKRSNHTYLYRIGTIHFKSNLRFEAEFWTPGYIVLSRSRFPIK
ncbi:hypothetical protein LEP1GSC175_3168 [Leptospira santarosai str. HAI821]|nr:hypothetical protein LEP1GSC175_3168 [Leptospira santarosai str. HAI821]